MMRRMLMGLGLAALILTAASSGVAFGQQPGNPDGIATIEKSGLELLRIWRSRTDGKNEVLAIVDGQPITTEVIKAEIGDPIETAIQTAMTLASDPSSGKTISYEEAEAQVVYGEVMRKASSIIIRRIAKESRLTVSDGQVDSRIDSLKEWRGIAKDDLAAWAEYTISNFGKTPLKFRDGLRGELMEYQALEVMAGVYGPIRGLDLPVFIPREVSPAELLAEYESKKEKWKILTDIDYTLVAIGLSTTTSISSRQIVDSALAEAARRLRNEPLADIETYLKTEISNIIDDTPKLLVEASVKVASDKEFDEFGSYVRGKAVGEMTGLQQHTKGDVTWRFFLRLNNQVVGVSREFSDMVVQEQLRNDVLERKGDANKKRVRSTLLEKAIVVPGSIVGR